MKHIKYPHHQAGKRKKVEVALFGQRKEGLGLKNGWDSSPILKGGGI